MKSLLLGAYISLLVSYESMAQKKLEKLWTSDKELTTPESVLFSPQSQHLYVSLIDGDATQKDGKGGIAILNMDGSLKNAKWITGLNAPKGMAMMRGKLYIADIDEVVVVDVKTAEVLKKIKVEGSTFLNDVTATREGIVYVSDTRQSKIYQIKEDVASLFMDEVPNVNGLKYRRGHLYALADKELWKIDANKQKTVIAKGFEAGGDGIEPVGENEFLVTCWIGLVYHVRADGSIEQLMDVRGKMNTADLGYDVRNKTAFIPTFGSNSVIAYKFQ